MNNLLNKRATLLAVLAHPDDESFGMGGTLAKYAERGAAVHLICATRGESGEIDADLLRGFTSIGDKREAELRCAADILGLDSVSFLDYRDSGMPGSADNQNPTALINADVAEVAAKVQEIIERIRPQVVLTFDPIGGYKHPDHIAMYHAATRAFNESVRSQNGDNKQYKPDRLFYYMISKAYLKFAVRIMPVFGQDPRRFGRNRDIDLASLVQEGDFPVHAKINVKAVMDKKAAAAQCHASQLDGRISNRGLLSWFARRTSGTETYMQASPEVTTDRVSSDLFEGLPVTWE